MTAVADSAWAVSCRGISKWFGSAANRTEVLRGLDLDVERGGLAMLVGPSGCGKTTLISIVAGLLGPTGGDLQVLGTRPAVLPERARILFRRANVGFIFQQFNLLPALTAAENAAVPLFVAGWRRKDALGKAMGTLDALGLAEYARRYPPELSGGQQQRLALARALIHDPRLIVCDEPTSALDARTGHRVMELLYKVAVRPDRAVIVVTHDNRILEFADSVAHMEDGRITGIDRRRSIRS
jgi:putative ABC transport system ATP-binding protein